MSTDLVKRCSRCGLTKPIEAFRNAGVKRTVDGRHGTCRNCEAADRRDRRVTTQTGERVVLLPRRKTRARPEPWMADKGCENIPTDVFFPARDDHDGQALAKAICAGCPVAAECLEYAQREGLTDGFFGGLSARQRKKLRALEAAS